MSEDKIFTDYDLRRAWRNGFLAGARHADLEGYPREYERDVIEAEASANRYVDAKVKLHTPGAERPTVNGGSE